MKSENDTPRRFGRLRPVAAKIMEWCIAGLEWTEMQRRLADENGILITNSALCVFATRHGFVQLHPYSTHYDIVVAYKFSRGDLTVEELKKTKNTPNTPWPKLN